MRKRLLRVFLGAGYVCLLTTLLLYQADVFGGRREWKAAVLGTLFLGVALAVVLALYLRVTDQIAKWKENSGADRGECRTAAETDAEKESVEGACAVIEESGGDQRASFGKEGPPVSGYTFADAARQPLPRSYEEIYACFLTTMEACALSERELEVAWLLYRGYTNRQIGEELYIAETTVKKHVSHIYQKMDVCSRKEFRAKVKDKMAEPSCPGG